MAYAVSPGITVREIDTTTVVPATATTVGAIAGVFRWGPVGERVLVDNETQLVNVFGRPSNHNPETWFCAADYLSYSGALLVARAANTTDPDANNAAHNAVAIVDGGSVSNIELQVVRNATHYESVDGTFDPDVVYVAKYPGALGNSLRVSVCENPNQYSSNVSLVVNTDVTTDATSIVFVVGSNTATATFVANASANSLQTTAAATDVAEALTVGDLIEVGNSSIGRQFLKVTEIGDVTTDGNNAVLTLSFQDHFRLSSNVTSNTITRHWEFANVVDGPPGTSLYVSTFGNTSAVDELHVVVVDAGGRFTGVPGEILEVFEDLSRATDAKRENGESSYYKTVINDTSNYIWWANDRANAESNTADSITSSTNETPLSIRMTDGSDGPDEASVTIGDLTRAWDLFASKEEAENVGNLIAGKARGGANEAQLANYIIDNIADIRRDCIVFVSPAKDDVVNNPGSEVDAVIEFERSTTQSSFRFTDSGYYYRYDKYNDVYRWIPLCGGTAGLSARTEQTNDAWWSPAGYNRGVYKNVIKLAWNPNQAQRDAIFKEGVNPVVTFPSSGTILYGDKTGLNRPSAFDRINVRKLFIVLEKSIAEAAKFSLFEFNDAFTRAQFKNLVIPYLRDVQGRRGITDFLVVCDETNNTPEVIDRNEFVGDIYIKPARSISSIQLNFVAVRTGVSFQEIVGQF